MRYSRRFVSTSSILQNLRHKIIVFLEKMSDEESESSASYKRAVMNVYNKKNFHDENSFASAKSQDDEGLIKD